MSIRFARSTDELRSCFDVMKQLRPRLELETFPERILRQQESGYRLVMALDGERVVAVAGFRIGENLAWGRFLYVDDLVTDAASRSAGHGARLLAWLEQHAVDQGCDELHLDSGVQRFGAHRFYLRHGMDITSHHFRALLRREPSEPGSC
jgi:GNAT superfamily N-acetyltransferase